MSSNSVNSPELPPVRLLLDDALAGRRMLTELQARAIPICTVAETLAPGATDGDLLARLAASPELVLVVQERDLHGHTTVQNLLRSCGGRACVVSGNKRLSAVQLADLIGRVWPRIRRLGRRGHRPFVAHLSASGPLTTLRGVV